jgi:hypothetical protein
MKKQIAILIPTRERSHKIDALHTQWFKMLDTSIITDCIIILHKDDEHTYPRLDGFIYYVCNVSGRQGMVMPINEIACKVCNDYEYLGFWGDDHFPQTIHWNSIMYNKLQANLPYAMVYADDLLQGINLPTEIIMDAKYVQKLGYICHPSLKHLYVDNLWLFIGNYMKNIHYIPDVIIEHLHYTVNKSPVDDTYISVNSSDILNHDCMVYNNIINDTIFITSLQSLKYYMHI